MLPKADPQARPAARKIGELGIGANNTEKAMTKIKTIGAQTPLSATQSWKGPASNVQGMSYS